MPNGRCSFRSAGFDRDVDYRAGGYDYSQHSYRPGTSGNCSLHAAITAVNQKTATDSCVAGTGNDTINFSVTGTITLGSPLPAIQNTLTIDGIGQAITVSGNSFVQLMTVNSSANLTLQSLMLTDGMVASTSTSGGGAMNSGTLTVANCTLSSS